MLGKPYHDTLGRDAQQDRQVGLELISVELRDTDPGRKSRASHVPKKQLP